jgi:hypothetical protein
MGNKIQILLDIDDFFSILIKKAQILWNKMAIKNGVDQFYPPRPLRPPLKKIWRQCMMLDQ